MIYGTYRNTSAADPEGAQHEAGPGGGTPLVDAGECRRGRPRSERVRAAILAAANLLLETGSVRELTIEAVAHAAGVGKPTVYRRWPTKAALVMDAFLAAAAPPPVVFREGGSAAEMLQEQFTQVVGLLRGRAGQLLAEVVGETQADPGMLEDFRARFLAVRRAAARRIVERGKAAGEFDPGLDTELALDLLYGPVFFRMMIGHQPLDRDFVETVPRLVVRGWAKGGPAGDRRAAPKGGRGSRRRSAPSPRSGGDGHVEPAKAAGARTSHKTRTTTE
jgi:AcrR family transcriptional regulator